MAMPRYCCLCVGELTRLYRPTGGRDVNICNRCGMVQGAAFSTAKRADLSASSSFGNIRYGKKLVCESDVDNISRELTKRGVTWAHLQGILDIGSSRGDFLRLASELAPQADLVGIEVDEDYSTNLNDIADVYHTMFEYWQDKTSRFDLIYCSHTLEHSTDPFYFMIGIWSRLSDNGFAYVRVPNLHAIQEEGIVEEWFLDKHDLHFTPMTLEQLLTGVGLAFDIYLEGPDIWAVVWRKNIDPVFRMVEEYEKKLQLNRQELCHVADWVSRNAEGTIVLWGAGRIYSALLECGLHPDVPVIDKYLPEEHRHHAVHYPYDFNEDGIETVVILSREYEDEIREEANFKFTGARIYSIRELLQ